MESAPTLPAAVGETATAARAAPCTLTLELRGDVHHAMDVVQRLTQSGALSSSEEDALLDGIVAGNLALLSLARLYGHEPLAFARHARRNLRGLRAPMWSVDALGSLGTVSGTCHGVAVRFG